MTQAQQFRVQFDDGREETVAVDGRDWLFYEIETGENSLDLLADGGGFRAWYVGACAAMRRAGRWDGTPQEFYDQVAFVLPVRGETPGPTTPEADSGNSA